MSAAPNYKAADVRTVQDLDEFLAHLKAHWEDDPEAGHLDADAIQTRVLRLVADGHPDAVTLAAKVLEIGSWDVRWWYA